MTEVEETPMNEPKRVSWCCEFQVVNPNSTASKSPEEDFDDFAAGAKWEEDKDDEGGKSPDKDILANARALAATASVARKSITPIAPPKLQTTTDESKSKSNKQKSKEREIALEVDITELIKVNGKEVKLSDMTRGDLEVLAQATLGQMAQQQQEEKEGRRRSSMGSGIPEKPRDQKEIAVLQSLAKQTLLAHAKNIEPVQDSDDEDENDEDDDIVSLDPCDLAFDMSCHKANDVSTETSETQSACSDDGDEQSQNETHRSREPLLNTSSTSIKSSSKKPNANPRRQNSLNHTLNDSKNKGVVAFQHELDRLHRSCSSLMASLHLEDKAKAKKGLDTSDCTLNRKSGVTNRLSSSSLLADKSTTAAQRLDTGTGKLSTPRRRMSLESNTSSRTDILSDNKNLKASLEKKKSRRRNRRSNDGPAEENPKQRRSRSQQRTMDSTTSDGSCRKESRRRRKTSQDRKRRSCSQPRLPSTSHRSNGNSSAGSIKPKRTASKDKKRSKSRYETLSEGGEENNKRGKSKERRFGRRRSKHGNDNSKEGDESIPSGSEGSHKMSLPRSRSANSLLDEERREGNAKRERRRSSRKNKAEVEEGLEDSANDIKPVRKTNSMINMLLNGLTRSKQSTISMFGSGSNGGGYQMDEILNQDDRSPSNSEEPTDDKDSTWTFTGFVHNEPSAEKKNFNWGFSSSEPRKTLKTETVKMLGLSKREGLLKKDSSSRILLEDGSEAIPKASHKELLGGKDKRNRRHISSKGSSSFKGLSRRLSNRGLQTSGSKQRLHER